MIRYERTHREFVGLTPFALGLSENAPAFLYLGKRAAAANASDHIERHVVAHTEAGREFSRKKRFQLGMHGRCGQVGVR